ncbi:hypothetical protein M513_11354 [Trichuris suis]|uniref:Uncharacterized protein n=1 Tax=Trichuris suis TaxID=68888 RepID=A0A085LS58_9BILA|nr:hypothetical protein M513_11354 [Trichuris suis]
MLLASLSKISRAVRVRLGVGLVGEKEDSELQTIFTVYPTFMQVIFSRASSHKPEIETHENRIRLFYKLAIPVGALSYLHAKTHILYKHVPFKPYFSCLTIIVQNCPTVRMTYHATIIQRLLFHLAGQILHPNHNTCCKLRLRKFSALFLPIEIVTAAGAYFSDKPYTMSSIENETSERRLPGTLSFKLITVTVTTGLQYLPSASHALNTEAGDSRKLR